MKQWMQSRAVLASGLALALAASPAIRPAAAGTPPKRPNILFIILDDVGIDQMRAFGYGGTTPPRTPNMDAIGRAGVRFRNVWAMPECSPSRAMFFEGRFPLRTNVLNALLDTDLANSQVSPYETTTPRVLEKKGYTSALFGKFHLAGPDHNPAGDGTPHALGWDYFWGFLQGAPYPIDTTAGGVAPAGTYPCGFVNDASSGACYFADGTCNANVGGSTPGRTCMEQGGILVRNQGCQSPAPSTLNFTQLNGYYVSPPFINTASGKIVPVPATDPSARGYRTTLETDEARDWINGRKGTRPWMATVSYSSAHAPYQQAPASLLPPGSPDASGLDCLDQGADRILSNQMIESMDTEIGRLLVETGLASQDSQGGLLYNPAATDTMVVIVGDNGTFAPGVKAPFDPYEAKGWVYQTGVWVPLIVSGPLVSEPNRDVGSMVNVADLFELFGEIAGVDVHQAVPPSHILDSVSMLPYLTNPDQASIRSWNFTQTGINLTANGVRPPPCVIEAFNTCVQVFTTQQVCEFEAGTWYGPGADAAHGGPAGLGSCCDVQAQYAPAVDILPDGQTAIRNDQYKLVQKVEPNCTAGGEQTVWEFYQIDERPGAPALDRPEANLLASPDLPPRGLTPEQLANFNSLHDQFDAVLGSEPPCPGDGNLDKVVNKKDLKNWRRLSKRWGESSVYDLNFDGVTDTLDQQIIEAHMGTRCLEDQ
jgi:arylsulfatase A-like enzyme